MSAQPDTITQTLSSAPPPMLEEILSTFAAQVDGDKDLLAAILRAKEAEELRIAAVAGLQQTIVQLQHTLAQASGMLPPSTPPPEPQPARSTSARRKPSSRAHST
ncbi:hypothetical protein BDV93DRAFT_518719 [Ceratobasidium sp. AG-I]|nr:hypothetical protein BDV93DRAFT_518719 [Ceratobasidium sp. AG-I]